MNNLSIFIYLAELIPAIGHMCVLFAFLASGGILVSFMLRDFNNTVYSFDTEQEIENKKSVVKLANKGLKAFPIVIVVCIVIATIIPSRQTIMMIAASEFGETLYKSDQIQEILNPASKLLKSFIKEELDKREKK